MLRLLGSPKKLCNGITRREMLVASGLSACGLAQANLAGAADARSANSDLQRAASYGKAKACILLYLYGSPSQLETVDMKPDAPVEIRGELKPIRSSLPGLDVCE